ncbi:putative reverse transcriptase domain-containing protein [Tanacetum coccineum]
MWKIDTDGASSSDDSGEGLILISPKGKEYTYALRFEFQTMNNITEYKALLSGLRTTNEMEIKSLAIFVDSQLIVNQVKGIFKARNQNKKYDALSKLASMTFEHLTKEVLVELLANRSINDREVSTIVAEKGEKLDESNLRVLNKWSTTKRSEKARKVLRILKASSKNGVSLCVGSLVSRVSITKSESVIPKSTSILVIYEIDDPIITMEEYIRLEEEKAHRRGKVYNCTYGKIWCDEDVHDLRYVETEFPAIFYNDALTYEVALLCEPIVSPLNNNQIGFRISFDEFDDEDYMVIYDKKSFSYKRIYVNDLKTVSENYNDKVNMASFPSSEPTVSNFDEFDYFKDFEKEFPAIAYNGTLTSKLDFSPEPTVNPQHIDEFNLKNETSLSECDGEEQNVIYFNDLFLFSIIYHDDLKSDKDNGNDKIDIK